MKYMLLFVGILLAIVAAGYAPARAQSLDTAKMYVWPPQLYPGENIITVNGIAGIREISVNHTPNMIIDGDGAFSCAKERELRVNVYTASAPANLEIRIEDCTGRVFRRFLQLNMNWTIDRQEFGRVTPGETVCETFHIRAGGLAFDGSTDDVILDTVTVDDPRVTLRFRTELPIRIIAGTTYSYEVCFTADRVGVYKFPVVTWLRRRYPFGGQATYPVADTGVVRVSRPRGPEPEPEPVTDPTTFRSILTPNAVIPAKGTLWAASYDFFGLMGGYAASDNVMILAGGALPTPDDWGGVRGQMYGAYSIGLKGGRSLGDNLDVAAGYQWARAIYDKEITPDSVESTITVNAPFAAVSYGDDDSRVSATFGYAFKNHRRPDLEFDRDVAFGVIGGDYRIAHNWKIAGEIAAMEDLGVLPIVATARYFTNRYAVDFGIAYLGIDIGDGAELPIPIIPVISGVFIF